MSKLELATKILNTTWNRTGKECSAARMLVALYNGTFLQELGDETSHPVYWKDFANAVRDFVDAYGSQDLEWAVLQVLDLNHVNKIGFDASCLYNNYLVLAEKDLISLLPDFCTDFRGEIVFIHRIGDYVVIETDRQDATRYHPITDISWVYPDLEQALLHQMFEEKYLPTVFKLRE